jgi:hypothetical protein
MQGRVFSSNTLQRHFAATPETARKGEGKGKQAVHWEVLYIKITMAGKEEISRDSCEPGY